MDDGLDRLSDENGRVVDDLILETRGKVLLELRHGLAYGGGKLERIGVGSLEDRDRDRVLVAQETLDRIRLRADLDTSYVAEVHDLAFGTRFDDDVAKLLLIREPSLCIDS